MTKGFRAGAAVLGALLFAAVLSFSGNGHAMAQEPLEVTFMTPEDGDVLGEQPFVFQMCFSRPINIKDLDKGGEFRFDVFDEANVGYGLRVVFQPDGWGVAVYPGAAPVLSPAPSAVRDHWIYRWHVVAADDGAPNDGEIKFKVDESAEPAPSETPPSCLPGGGTGTPGPTGRPDVTPTPGESESPTDTPEPSDGPSATEEPGGENGEDDGSGVDTDEMIAGTLILFGLLAIGGLAAYFVRKRVGYEPHEPGPDSDDGGHH
jgi:hypothetical protein